MRASLKSLLLCAATLAVLTGCSGKGGRPPCPEGKLCILQGNGYKKLIEFRTTRPKPEKETV